jgi:hypothetical protein
MDTSRCSKWLVIRRMFGLTAPIKGSQKAGSERLRGRRRGCGDCLWYFLMFSQPPRRDHYTMHRHAPTVFVPAVSLPLVVARATDLL